MPPERIRGLGRRITILAEVRGPVKRWAIEAMEAMEAKEANRRSSLPSLLSLPSPIASYSVTTRLPSAPGNGEFASATWLMMTS
jgi:hypothetical protein